MWLKGGRNGLSAFIDPSEIQIKVLEDIIDAKIQGVCARQSTQHQSEDASIKHEIQQQHETKALLC